MWAPNSEEITYFKRIGQCENIEDQYAADMLGLLFDHVNEECTVSFEVDSMPSNVKLFLAQALSFFSVLQPGLRSENVSSASFNYDFNQLPKVTTDLLSQYGYGKKRGYARFRAF